MDPDAKVLLLLTPALANKMERFDTKYYALHTSEA